MLSSPTMPAPVRQDLEARIMAGESIRGPGPPGGGASMAKIQCISVSPLDIEASARGRAART